MTNKIKRMKYGLMNIIINYLHELLFFTWQFSNVTIFHFKMTKHKNCPKFCVIFFSLFSNQNWFIAILRNQRCYQQNNSVFITHKI